MRVLTIPCIILALFSCNHPGTKENKFDLTVVKNHINEANKVYGERFENGDTAYYAERYCHDAVIMPEKEEAISGRDGIRMFNYNDGKNKGFKIDVTATSVYGGPDAVIEEGFYTFPGEDGKITAKGKFIAIWKQEEGKWKLYREIWNTDNPPEE